MAKRRKTKKSSKCPEPINTMLDIAASVAIGYFADRRRKKKGAKSKIDPYAATGVAMGLGKINSTDDLIAFGGMLGALGAFNDDDSDYSNSYHVNDNRYAWRLNCIDGSEYGIYPENYETRDEYNEAIAEQIAFERGTLDSDDSSCTSEFDGCFFDTENDISLYCRVSRLDNGVNAYYLTGEHDVKIGDKVIVPTDTGTAEGIVIAVTDSSPDDQLFHETILGVSDN